MTIEIVDFPIKIGDFQIIFNSYVKLPEGTLFSDNPRPGSGPFKKDASVAF